MRARKTQPLTPAQVFGRRVRELRELRQLSQTSLAAAVGIDRTTLNHIEHERRSDVSISQLFKFAEALGTEPVYLLSPRLDDEHVELTVGGRVLPPPAERRWLRGEPPADATPLRRLEWFLALPRDEQLELLARGATAGMDPIVAAVMKDVTAGRVDAAVQALDALVTSLRESGAAPRKLRAGKGKGNG